MNIMIPLMRSKRGIIYSGSFSNAILVVPPLFIKSGKEIRARSKTERYSFQFYEKIDENGYSVSVWGETNT
jgi:hypothetical protein